MSEAQTRCRISRLHWQIVNLVVPFLFVLVMAITPSARAQTFTLVHTFNYSNGAEPYNNVFLQDAKGNFYSATDYGALGACFFGCGVVFKLDKSGKETVLYKFTGGKDGGMPYGLSARDAAGNYYGATLAGGYFGGQCAGYGCGTVFKIDSTGKETVLYRFVNGKDGNGPYGGVIRDSKGNLYGTAVIGGGSGGGTAFKLNPSGKLTVLHSFQGTKDGELLLAGLVRDPKGNLYGTASAGGASGDGTVFKLSPTGEFTVLHTFAGGKDGEYPGYGPLLLDAAGNLYGTTRNGGGGACSDGCGVVFKLDTTGKETVLHRFNGTGDAATPYAALIQDAAGNFYGTGESGGSHSSGAVFKLDPAGKETLLYSFTGGNDGGGPLAGLFEDAQGNFYGTTYGGGAHGIGTIFKLTP